MAEQPPQHLHHVLVGVVVVIQQDDVPGRCEDGLGVRALDRLGSGCVHRWRESQDNARVWRPAGGKKGERPARTVFGDVGMPPGSWSAPLSLLKG